MSPEHVELLVLGSGQGGKLLAWHMAQAGRHTAVVERRWVGGSCPNIACMPSKNEIWGARVAYLVHHAAQFGTVTGAVTTDMSRVRQRKREMVEREVAFHLERYKSTGAELIMGSGRFVAPKTLEVQLNDCGTRLLTGDRVFLNIGSHATIPDIPGLAAASPLTHIEALELDYLPAHLVVLGGGYVGLEIAQAYRRFGSQVTVIEPGPRIMSREDPDVAEEIERILSDEGIEFLLITQTLAVQGRSGDKVSIAVRTGSGERRVEASDILAGRPIPPGSALTPRASNSMRAAIFASTSGRRPAHRMSGRSASAPAVLTLRTHRSMTSGSSGTIWPAEIARHATGWCRIACSSTPCSRMSD